MPCVDPRRRQTGRAGFDVLASSYKRVVYVDFFVEDWDDDQDDDGFEEAEV